MSTFKDGLEAAAKLVEREVPHLPEIAAALARMIRELQEPATGSEIARAQYLEAVQADAFEQFKAAYKPLGFRNNWVAARKKFDLLVKKEKIAPEQIVAGAVAYARTRPERQYVPAPEVFLNKRQFAYDWANSRPSRGPSPNDVEAFFQNRVDDPS